MAIKSTFLLGTLLSVLLATAAATTFTTTVTTTTNDGDSNPGQQCQQQIQGRQFQLCQRYLSPRGQSMIIALDEDQVEVGKDYEKVRDCCREMRDIDEQCRCEALNHIVRQLQQQQQQGAGRGQQLQEVYERARALPQLCNPRAGECQIRSQSMFL